MPLYHFHLLTNIQTFICVFSSLSIPTYFDMSHFSGKQFNFALWFAEVRVKLSIVQNIPMDLSVRNNVPICGNFLDEFLC